MNDERRGTLEAEVDNTPSQKRSLGTTRPSNRPRATKTA